MCAFQLIKAMDIILFEFWCCFIFVSSYHIFRTNKFFESRFDGTKNSQDWFYISVGDYMSKSLFT